MSKSLGNILTIRELLKEYNGEVLRFAMLSTHYRQPINFSRELLESSYKQLRKIYLSMNLRPLTGDVSNNIPESLLDDMNTPLAITEIHDLVKKLNNHNINDNEWVKYKNNLQFYGNLMGLFNISNIDSLKSKEILIDNKEKKGDRNFNQRKEFSSTE